MNEHLLTSRLQITDVEIARVIRTRKVFDFFLLFSRRPDFFVIRNMKRKKEFQHLEKEKNKQPHPVEKLKLHRVISMQTLPESDDSTGFNGTPQVMVCSNEDISKHMDIGLA